MTVSTGLDQIVTSILADAGLAANISNEDIMAGAAAAEGMNIIIENAITATGAANDDIFDENDVRAINAHIRANDLTLFTELHGDDANDVETGYHLVQSDGATTRFMGKNLINKVADGLYHIGFEIEGDAIVNEDGNVNATLTQLADWLNNLHFGFNVVDGTAGNDDLRGSMIRDIVTLGDGDDSVRSHGGDDEISGGAGNDSIRSGRGDDQVDGGAGNDIIKGASGDDYLRGDSGDDMIFGHRDNDRLDGGSGNDELRGGRGEDVLEGGSGDDMLFGGHDADLLAGGSGSDSLRGGRGEDALFGEQGDDLLLGGHDNDWLDGGEGNDDLRGHKGNDTLMEQFGSDTLSGGHGDDTLISRSDAGEPGNTNPDADDVLKGGAGADSFVFRLDINAGADIALRHTDETGSVDWQGVAGENGANHDHWVDSIGNDEIRGYREGQGDTIIIEGHTVVANVTQVDANDDGKRDYSLISLVSDQGGAGAHDGDDLGSIRVYGDVVTLDDLSVDRMVFHGAYDTFDLLIAV